MEKRIISVKGLELGNTVTKICVPLVAADESGLRSALTHALTVPFDLVEFRADFIEGLTEEVMAGRDSLLLRSLTLIRERIPDRPILFTYRTEAEGGAGTSAPETYISVNLMAAVSGLADLADVEAIRDEKTARIIADGLHAAGLLAVGSNHDFEKTPPADDIVRRLVRMQEMGMDITKCAFMPRSRMDVIRLMDASVRMWEIYADRPYITMSMGELGKVSRIAGTLTGSAVTFATAGAASAPGQIGFEAVESRRELL